MSQNKENIEEFGDTTDFIDSSEITNEKDLDQPTTIEVRTSFTEIEDFLKDYPKSHSTFSAFESHFSEQALTKIVLTEGVEINLWKNTKNISARLISYDEDVVILECLIDKDKKIYEEWELSTRNFKGMELQVGKFFKLCHYERNNQLMMEILDTPGLVMESDFPKTDFYNKFKNLVVNQKN
jgi:hypothetical protein